MGLRNRRGSNDRRIDRGPRNEQLAGRLDYADTPANIAFQADRLVDELVANGAEPTFRPSEGALPASFTYELKAGGDRQRCREIIVEAKSRPLVWAAMLRAIAKKSEAIG